MSLKNSKPIEFDFLMERSLYNCIFTFNFQNICDFFKVYLMYLTVTFSKYFVFYEKIHKQSK